MNIRVHVYNAVVVSQNELYGARVMDGQSSEESKGEKTKKLFPIPLHIPWL